MYTEDILPASASVEAPRKKDYSQPRLIEYGEINTVTQGFLDLSVVTATIL